MPPHTIWMDGPDKRRNKVSVGEDAEKGNRQALLVGMETVWSLRKAVQQLLKSNTELPYDPALPLLGMHQKK